MTSGGTLGAGRENQGIDEKAERGGLGDKRTADRGWSLNVGGSSLETAVYPPLCKRLLYAGRSGSKVERG